MRLMFLCVTVLLPAVAFGQVNIERMRIDDKPGWSGSVGVDGEYRSGNSDLYEIGVNARVDALHANRHFFVVGTVRYGERNSTTFKNSAFLHVRNVWQATPHFAQETFGQLERDGFTLLQLRALAGAGGRVTYVRTDAVRLHQGTALMLENERLEAKRVEVHPALKTTVRWSNYASIRVRLGASASVTSATYIQPRLADFGDFRLLSETTLDVRLSRRVSLTATTTLRHDSKPPDRIEPTDVIVRPGLRVGF